MSEKGHRRKYQRDPNPSSGEFWSEARHKKQYRRAYLQNVLDRHSKLVSAANPPGETINKNNQGRWDHQPDQSGETRKANHPWGNPENNQQNAGDGKTRSDKCIGLIGKFTPTTSPPRFDRG